MVAKANIAHNIIREAVRKKPDAPARTIARGLYAKHPELWPSLDNCRAGIRYVLGLIGDSKRKRAVDKELFRKPRQAGWVDVIPQSYDEGKDWGAVQIDGAHRCLVLSDIHLPFHDAEALELALQYGSNKKATLILLNGDICDHYAQSTFLKNPTKDHFANEIEQTRFFLAGLRKRFPKSKIVYKLGNHEERYIRYMQTKAEELLGIEDFTFKKVFRLDEQQIELVDQRNPIRLGELNVLHGHEHAKGIAAPVNPARGLFLRSKCHTVCGHFHQSSQHSENNVEQKVISTWSTGCLCGLHPEYLRLNNWNHGFAFVEAEKSGTFRVDNLRIY